MNVKGHPAAEKAGIQKEGGRGLDEPTCCASSFWHEVRCWLQPKFVRQGRKIWNCITLGTRRGTKLPKCLWYFSPSRVVNATRHNPALHSPASSSELSPQSETSPNPPNSEDRREAGCCVPSCCASSFWDEFRSNGWILNCVESTLSSEEKEKQRKSFKSQSNYHPNNLLILDESDIPPDQRDLVKFLRATKNHENRAADRGCCVSPCCASSFSWDRFWGGFLFFRNIGIGCLIWVFSVSFCGAIGGIIGSWIMRIIFS